MRVDAQVGLLVVVVALLRVIVVAAEEVDAVAGRDGADVRPVRPEVPDDVVGPRLEPLHPVDEEVGLEDRLADARPRLPTMAVLADRHERLRGRGVARYLRREVAEHEERGLRSGALRAALSASPHAAGERPEGEGGRSPPDELPPGALHNIIKNYSDFNKICD